MRRIGLPLMCVSLVMGLLLAGPAASDVLPPDPARVPEDPPASLSAGAVPARAIGFDLADADAARLGEADSASWTSETEPAPDLRQPTLAARTGLEGPELLLDNAEGQNASRRTPFTNEHAAEVSLQRTRPADLPPPAVREPSPPARTVPIPGVLLPEKPRERAVTSAPDRPAPSVREPGMVARTAAARRSASAAAAAAARQGTDAGTVARVAATERAPVAAERRRPAPSEVAVSFESASSRPAPKRSAGAPRLEPAVMMALPDELSTVRASADRRTDQAPRRAVAGTRSLADAPPLPDAAGERDSRAEGIASIRAEHAPESPIAIPVRLESPEALPRRVSRPEERTVRSFGASTDALRRSPAAPAARTETAGARTVPGGTGRFSGLSTKPSAPMPAAPSPEATLARIAASDAGDGIRSPVETAVETPPPPPARTVGRLPDPSTEAVAAESIRTQARRVEARALYRRAVSLFESQAYEPALALFETAAQLDPSFAGAREYRDRTRGLIGETGTTEEADRVLEDIIRSVEHTRQAAEIQLRTELEKAEQLYLTALEPSPQRRSLPRPLQITEEVRDLRLAQEKLDHVATLLAGSTLPTPAREELRLRMEALSGRVTQALDRRLEEQDALARRRAAQSTEEMRERTRRTQEEQVDQLVEQARHYMDRHEYDKAIEIAEEILADDPDNTKANTLLRNARRERHDYIAWEIREDWDYRQKVGVLNEERWFEAQSEHIEYPEDWDDILRRSSDYGTFGESTEAEQEIRRRLQGTRTSVDFPSRPLREALEYISEVGNVNIVINDTGLDPVDPEEPVNLSVRNKSLEKILKFVMDLTDNQYVVRDEVVEITRGGGERTFIEIYPVSDLTADAVDFYTENVDEDEEDIEEVTLIDVIQETISPDTWNEADRSIDLYADKLIVKQTKEVHDAIHAYLENIREFTKQQVLVDVRLLDINQDWLEEIGFTWSDIDSQSVDGDTGDFLRVDSAFWPSAGATEYNDTGGISLDFFQNLGDVAFWRNVQVQGFLHAVQQERAGTILHQPRVQVASGQSAALMIKTTQEFVTAYETTDEVSKPVKGEFEQGIDLSVRPIVSFDGKYVTMRLSPRLSVFDQENLRVEDLTWFYIVDSDNDIDPYIAEASGRITYFASTTQEIQTTATLPDGGTMLLGGLVRDNRREAISGVPMVSNIPYVGNLFRSRHSEVDGSNVIFMVGANIIELE